jgi:serine/threonine protein kinase
MGTIMAELFTLKPIFPGSSEIDEIYKICSIVGAPAKIMLRDGENLSNVHFPKYLTVQAGSRLQIQGGGPWPQGQRLAADMGFRFPNLPPLPLGEVIPEASDKALHLMAAMLRFDPDQRPTALEAMQSPWFEEIWDTPLGRTAFTPQNTTFTTRLVGEDKGEEQDSSDITSSRKKEVLRSSLDNMQTFKDAKKVNQQRQTVDDVSARPPSSSSSFELPYSMDNSGHGVNEDALWTNGFYNGTSTSETQAKSSVVAPFSSPGGAYFKKGKKNLRF